MLTNPADLMVIPTLKKMLQKPYQSCAHFSLTALLEHCETFDQLRQLHSQVITVGLATNPTVQTQLINFCCGFGSDGVMYARRLFDEIPKPGIFLWNTMMKGYSGIRTPGDGILLYMSMLKRDEKPDHCTYPFLLKGFNRYFALTCGRQLHGHVVKFGLEFNEYVQYSLVHVYSSCGYIQTARQVFDLSGKRDAVAWNALITGYNKLKQFHESRSLYYQMERNRNEVVPTTVTYLLALTASSKLRDLMFGVHLHKQLEECKVEVNLALRNALLDMYAACGAMDVALENFEGMKTRDVISWTCIVTGFVNLGQVGLARSYFDKMPQRDLVSWTTMINGYLQANEFKEVLALFREMQTSNVKPDEYTVVSVLTACANLGALELGEWMKTYINRNKVKNDIFVGNALLDMYFKCGCVEKARKEFDEMPRRDKFTWTAMVVGLAINGHGEEALSMFSRMLTVPIEPDEVTYIGVLSACTHTGMVERGRQFFSNMTAEHGIQPNIVHYGCMVDLLGRAGFIEEAYGIIKNMPMTPNAVVWGTLLSACRVHKDPSMAVIAAKQILELEPENGAVYVLLCNIYAYCKRWESLGKLRRTIMEKGIRKPPGCSTIEMNGLIHEFVASDRSHPRSREIYAKLEEMMRDLKLLAGYEPDTSEVFSNIGEEEKESAVFRHSEKLAMAFALISSGPRTTIRIMKNLRVCLDCHQVAKLVSKLYDHEVVIRDRTRYHHFKDGACSCKDYW